MSKRRELRQLLFQCREALAGGEHIELVEKLDRALDRAETWAQSRGAPDLRVPPQDRQAPMALAQVRVYPFTEQLGFNGLMFDEPGQFWRYVFQLTNERPAFGQVERPQTYIQPREIAEFLARGGKVQRIESPEERRLAARKATKSLEEMGL